MNPYLVLGIFVVVATIDLSFVYHYQRLINREDARARQA